MHLITRNYFTKLELRAFNLVHREQLHAHIQLIEPVPKLLPPRRHYRSNNQSRLTELLSARLSW